MSDSYIYVITALLPLAASMLVLQVNPYHALVIRGILGAIAALVYAVLGAADVALTEALVGTMLATLLCAVAVRSSLVMRLGVLKEQEVESGRDRDLAQLIDDLQTLLSKRHLRLELVPYRDRESLDQALITKEVHATCVQAAEWKAQDGTAVETDPEVEKCPYRTVTRIRRIHEIMQTELSSPTTSLTYISVRDAKITVSEAVEERV